MMIEDRMRAPATERNRDALLAVLRRHLPLSGLVLEIASGTGEHVAHFAEALPHLSFQPSDPDSERRRSIDAWADGRRNIRPALAIDARQPIPLLEAEAVLCINMVHIAPWSATLGLLDHAAMLLPVGAPLILYGPFAEGAATAPSNRAFDADLRARDPEWGVRELAEVTEAALAAGFAEPEVERMPANNLVLVFRRDFYDAND